MTCTGDSPSAKSLSEVRIITWQMAVCDLHPGSPRSFGDHLQDNHTIRYRAVRMPESLSCR
jgi:hypothetical protein